MLNTTAPRVQQPASPNSSDQLSYSYFYGCHSEFCVNDVWSRLQGGSKHRLHKIRYGI
jgi:hypothetical protein